MEEERCVLELQGLHGGVISANTSEIRMSR